MCNIRLRRNFAHVSLAGRWRHSGGRATIFSSNAHQLPRTVYKSHTTRSSPPLPSQMQFISFLSQGHPSDAAADGAPEFSTPTPVASPTTPTRKVKTPSSSRSPVSGTKSPSGAPMEAAQHRSPIGAELQVRARRPWRLRCRPSFYSLPPPAFPLALGVGGSVSGAADSHCAPPRLAALPACLLRSARPSC